MMERSFKDSSSINSYLKELHATNKSFTLPLDLGVSFVEILIKNIIVLPTEEKEKANSVTTLSNLIHFLPASSQFNYLFNNHSFLISLINFAIANPLDDAPYIILTSYLRGDFLEHQTISSSGNNDNYNIFFNIFLKNMNILENIPKRVYTMNKSLIKTSTEFVIALVAVASTPENVNYALKIFIVLRQLDFTSLFKNFIMRQGLGSPKVIQMVGTYHAQNLAKILNNLTNAKFDIRNNSLHQGILTKLCYSFKSFHHLIPTAKLGEKITDEDVFIASGLTSDPVKFIADKYNIATALTCLQFTSSPSTNAFKIKCKQQYVLTPEVHKRFPINRFICDIALLNNEHFYHKSNPNFEVVTKFLMYADRIFCILMDKAFSYWEKAEGDNRCEEDISCIINLIKLDLKYINSVIINTREFSEVKEQVLKLNYENIKQLQLTFFKNNQFLDVIDHKDLLKFDNDIIENLKFFIIKERFTELSIGNTCFSEDPVNLNSNNYSLLTSNKNKMKKRLYVTLSPNRSMIYYKSIPETMKLKHGQHLDLDKSNSNSVLIRSIKKVMVNDSAETNKPAEFYFTNASSSSSSAASLENASLKGSNPDFAKFGNRTGNVMTSNNTFLNNSKHFITIGSRNAITKIDLVDAESKSLFTFYTDNKHNAILWIDSLNLLINDFNFKNITDETKFHMEQLFDIKRTMQFSPLNQILHSELINLYTGQAKHGNFLQLDNIKFDSHSRLVKKDFHSILSNHKFNDLKNVKNTNGNVTAAAAAKKKKLTDSKSNSATAAASATANGNGHGHGSSKLSNVILEVDEELGTREPEFNYNYEELLSISDGFYYT